jgi:hypothetical protein
MANISSAYTAAENTECQKYQKYKMQQDFWLVVSSENAQLSMEEPELRFQIG